MNSLEKLNTTLENGGATTEEALKFFDELESVNLEFMIGRWQGSEFPTNHPMDGLLEASGWYGKEFVDVDQVHPLLFSDGNNNIFKVDPNPTAMNLGLRLPILKSQAMKPIFTLMNLMLKTEKSQARMRMMEYRQKVSATMIYDNLPINDIFRKIDDNTVLGLMDFKGVPQPFFFVLKRDI
ncbi:MAG: DUF4334 domain-containing protein [Okeania sp. SIO2F4]|uniref:DUF4334 domain-containing protein n=1 Tax=Okeania sp. SIO2F4 TaxID=2607790 RepID=UPI001429B2C2|nr:DUF4334 domain-containing protein [Okeania sp. SIO2F4]NES06743.1 DUF4334 domain-containing protein [Okeania sp. SIO2F4]